AFVGHRSNPLDECLQCLDRASLASRKGLTLGHARFHDLTALSLWTTRSRGGAPAMITLYDHPLSPYAQKVRIALREKGVPFQVALPGGLGAGGAAGEFAEANPRAEVPVLIDGEARVFDSTIILEYLEDAYPTPAMLPASAAERAR